jgi:subtilisin family serine protease
MRFFIIVICQIFFLLAGFNATASTYFVTFKYKVSKEFSLKTPSDYLSDKSIRRRVNQNIAIDSSDLPVSRTYISLVGSLVDDVLISSKWLNGVLVDVAADRINSLFLLDFVKDVKLVCADSEHSDDFQKVEEVAVIGQNQVTDEIYGDAFAQVSLVKGNYLHQNGFKGKGITIAVLDVGFPNYRNLAAFADLNSGRVVDTYDFTKRRSTLNALGVHGTKVLSLLTGTLPGRYCGSATEANYALYVTESAKYEQLIEEYFWCLAAERADSIGCDIISSSLGYNHFDNSCMDHLISDLSKHIAPISIAASAAFKKGIFVVVSAGNEGDKDWRYVTFPADSPEVMAVGAVSINGTLGVFSSIGLPKTIKPDVVGMGVAASMIDVNGDIIQGNGTSYVVPQVAGFSACLWQAFPNLSAVDLKNVICGASSNHLTPDNLIGYGIPNFELSFKTLKSEYSSVDQQISVSPNPFTTSITVKAASMYSGNVDYYLYNLRGELLKTGAANFSEGITRIDGLENLHSGMIILKFIFGGNSVAKKVVKQG